jgi:hypothetical protein
MQLENNVDEPIDGFRVVATDLLGGGGGRIPASSVSFEPESVRLEPGVKQRLEVRVDVPQETAPGVYTGLLQSSKIEHVRAVLTIEVRIDADEPAADEAS